MKNNNKSKIIEKIIIYSITVLILFSSIYCLINSFDKKTIVEISIKQKINNDIKLYYYESPYESKLSNITITPDNINEFQTIIFEIPTNNIYKLELEFLNSSKNQNIIEIENINIKTLFTSKEIDEFKNFKIESTKSNKYILINELVFNNFQTSYKLKIISFIISLLLFLVMRRKINNYILYPKNSKDRIKILIFVSIITLIFILNIIIIDKKYDSLLYKNLTEKPVINSYEEIIDGSFMTNYEQYLKENFIYNNTFIEDYFAYNYLLSKNNFKDNYITKYKDLEYIFTTTKLDNESLNRNVDNITEFNKFLQEKNIPFYYFLAPNKQLVNENIIPNYIHDDSKIIYNTFKSNLEENNILAYSLAEYITDETLKKNIDSHYRLDHHWTTETSFIAYNYILDILKNNNINFVDSSNIKYEKKQFSEVSIGSEGRSLAYGYRYNQKLDDLLILVPENSNFTVKGIFDKFKYTGSYMEILKTQKLFSNVNYTSTYSIYDTNMAENRVITNNNLETDSTIVILGDSYANPVSLFLLQNFKNVILFDQRNLKNNEVINYINENYETIDVIIGLNFLVGIQNTNLFNYFE